ncbi:hypothetical protein [Dokdonella soli]|uniref:Uncharacterized protein n=1 Tax=Dokdonella soli TaxID=529810 RepID=A0ABP3TMD8_9GAMM
MATEGMWHTIAAYDPQWGDETPVTLTSALEAKVRQASKRSRTLLSRSHELADRCLEAEGGPANSRRRIHQAPNPGAGFNQGFQTQRIWRCWAFAAEIDSKQPVSMSVKFPQAFPKCCILRKVAKAGH